MAIPKIEDKIIVHEDFNSSMSFRQKLAAFWRRYQPAKGMPKIGDPETGEIDMSALDKVEAFIDHGRWIVECPSSVCAWAILAPDVETIFVCASCGTPEYFRIVFPRSRQSIETELMKRPSRIPGDPWKADHRNWRPGETLGFLRQENAAHGVN